MLWVLWLVLVLIAGFLLSNLFRIKNKYASADCFFHYQAAEQIKENNFKLYKNIDTYLIENPPDYPPLSHYLLAFLPKGKILSWGRFIGSFFDIIQKILVYAIAFHLTKSHTISLIAVVAYSFIPIAEQEQVDASPRTIGCLFFNISLLSTYFSVSNNIVMLMVSIVFVMLTTITHRFSLQPMLLIFIFFGVAYNYLFVAALIVGLLLSGLLTNFPQILRSHITQLRVWQSMRKYLLDRKAGVNKTLVKVYESFFSNSLDLFVVFIYFISPSLFVGLEFFIIWVILIRIVSLVVSNINSLRLIGEGYRYLAYNALPAAVLSAIVLARTDFLWAKILFGLVMLVSLLALLVWQRVYTKQGAMYLNKGILNAIDWLKKQKTNRLVAVPYTFGRTLAYLSKKKTFFTTSPLYFDKIKEIYWGTMPLKDICRKYKLDNLFVLNYKSKSYDLSFAKKMWSNEEVSFYEVPKSFFK